MSGTVQNTTADVKINTVRLRGRGQITIPQPVRDKLSIIEGDMLTLLQIGDVVLLTPKQPQVPQLADRIVALMESEGVSLADLLTGLEDERETTERERQRNA